MPYLANSMLVSRAITVALVLIAVLVLIACGQPGAAELPLDTPTVTPQPPTATPAPTPVLRLQPPSHGSPSSNGNGHTRSDSRIIKTRGQTEFRPAPDFELETFDGGTLRLSDLEGKVVVLNFWASWCPPCRWEMPFLKLCGTNIVIEM